MFISLVLMRLLVLVRRAYALSCTRRVSSVSSRSFVVSFICRKLVAKHEFDPGRITFYGVYNDWIDLTTTDKKAKLFCRLKVRVQYVRSTDYFTCPSCPRLNNHEPVIFLGNIESITLNKLIKKKTRVTLKCGKFKETTEYSDDCTFNHHFMVHPSLLTKKKMTVLIYKKEKLMGQCKIDMESLEEGNWCDLKLTV